MPRFEESHEMPFPDTIPAIIGRDKEETLADITDLCTTGGYIILQENSLRLSPQRTYVPAEHAIDRKTRMNVSPPNEPTGILYAVPKGTLLHYFDEDGKRINVSEEEERVFNEVRRIMQFALDTARRPERLSEQTEKPFSIDDFFVEQVKKMTGKSDEAPVSEEITIPAEKKPEPSTHVVQESDQQEILSAEEPIVIFHTKDTQSLPEEPIHPAEPDIPKMQAGISSYEIPFTFIPREITLLNMENFFVENGFNLEVAQNFIAGADLRTLFSEAVLTSKDINTLVEKCSYLVALLDNGVVFYYEKIPQGKKGDFDVRVTALPIGAFEQRYNKESFTSYFVEGFLTRKIRRSSIFSNLLKKEFLSQAQLENEKTMWVAEKNFARDWKSEPVKTQGYYRFYQNGSPQKIDSKHGIGHHAGLYLEHILGEELSATLYEYGVSLNMLLGICFYQSVANMDKLYGAESNENKEH